MENYTNMYQNNGRVADVTNASTLDYPLHTQACVKSDLKDSIKTLHESNTLSKVLFSAKNIEIIQSNIRHQVYLLSEKKYIIDKQSETEVLIMLRSIYLQYGKNQDCNIKEQITELNNLVVREAAPLILSNIKQYLGYLNDVENMPRPMEHPRNMSSAGSKSLRGIL